MIPDGDTCEVKVKDEWVPIPVDKALMMHKDRVKRCPECHGRVQVHKASEDGMRAHFEHKQAHTGCSRGHNFAGEPSRHPRAIS